MATKNKIPVKFLTRNPKPCYFFMTRRAACLIFLTAIIFVIAPLSAQAGNLMKVGVLEEPKTLNIWLASDVWSNKVLRLIYQPLYTRDPATLSLIPWLAKDDPVYDSKSNSYTVILRDAQCNYLTPITA